MIINGRDLWITGPIADMVQEKLPAPGGTSYGLGEAGYDIRIKQEIVFKPSTDGCLALRYDDPTIDDQGFRTAAPIVQAGRFTLASAIEPFHMPNNLVGVVHDKSTWARRGLSVFNTVIEPGWKGYLTLELVYHGEGELIIPAGAGIAQVVFTETSERRAYLGKYQNQPDQPVPAIDTPPAGHLTIPGSTDW